MKPEEYRAWIMKGGKIIRNLGSYFCFSLSDAKILAKADAIKMGYDLTLVKVVKEE